MLCTLCPHDHVEASVMPVPPHALPCPVQKRGAHTPQEQEDFPAYFDTFPVSQRVELVHVPSGLVRLCTQRYS